MTLDLPTVLIFGGTGFVGRHIASELSKKGYRIKIPTRAREQQKSRLIILPNVELVHVSEFDSPHFSRLFHNVDYVINCVGILHEKYKGEFINIHANHVKRIVDGCNASHVKRLIHISALKASSDAPSEYLRSKAMGEQMIHEYLNKNISRTILQPSVIFGEGDSFLTMFAKLGRLLPILPLAKPLAQFQPVWIGDVVSEVVRGIRSDNQREIKTICGPKRYNLKELVSYACSFQSFSPRVIGLPDSIAFAQARVFELLGMRLITRDNLKSMMIDNVCADNCVSEQTSRRAIEEIAPSYLGQNTTR